MGILKENNNQYWGVQRGPNAWQVLERVFFRKSESCPAIPNSSKKLKRPKGEGLSEKKNLAENRSESGRPKSAK
jgi:hypothetical protein